MRLLSILPLTCLLAACASSPPVAHYKSVPKEQEAQVAKEMCEHVACVDNVHVVLKKADGSLYDQMFDSVPVVQENGVSVYAGQKVLFEADVEGDKLTGLKLVTQVLNPSRTLSAELKQVENGQMMLEIKNPFDRDLKISMGLMPLDTDRLLATTSCPIMAGIMGIEFWPQPIFQVWLGDMRFIPRGQSMGCTE